MRVVRLSVLLFMAISLLECNGIRIRGSNSITYNPSSPSSNRLSCLNGNDQRINNATWTRNGDEVDPSMVQSGQLILERDTIGTDNPQGFEGRYRCHSNGETSGELAFYVVPTRITTPAIVREQLEGTNVTIKCPLRFGSLRDEWSVEWSVEDSQDNRLSPSGYFTQNNPKFQLVIKNASTAYDGAKFICQAIRNHVTARSSQTITLDLFHEPEITSRPSDPIVVSLAHGIVNYEIKAYPRPSIKFCYNDTCIGSGRHGKIQITNYQNNATSHTAQFTVNRMTEEDNGNVTLELSNAAMNFSQNYTVMLFLPYKIQLSKNGSITTNQEVPLLIKLRQPLHFQYHIEFLDMEKNLLDTMEGMRGQATFPHLLSVQSDTEVTAHFRIGGVSGPDSDPVTVDVDNAETTESNNNNSVVFIVVAALVAAVLLAVIAAITYLIKSRWNRKRDSPDTPHSTESGTRDNDESEGARAHPPVLAQNEQRDIAMNPINPQHPIQFAVIAPTPGDQMHGIYPQGPLLVRPLFGSANSDHSSIPSRKSSAGYESATPSFHCPCAANYHPPRYCHCEHDHHCTAVPQHHQQYHQQQEQLEDEHNGAPQLSNSQQQPATTNLSNPKPTMRRNSSDPNISRHKQSPSRSLEDQRTKKLLSSSSVV